MIVKKMVIICILYPVVEGQEQFVLIYSEEEQATYLENLSKYQDS